MYTFKPPHPEEADDVTVLNTAIENSKSGSQFFYSL